MSNNILLVSYFDFHHLSFIPFLFLLGFLMVFTVLLVNHIFGYAVLGRTERQLCRLM